MHHLVDPIDRCGRGLGIAQIADDNLDSVLLRTIETGITGHDESPNLMSTGDH